VTDLKALINPGVERAPGYRGFFEPVEYTRVDEFYRAHPELQPTPLRSLPAFAHDLSLDQLLLKDETGRFGLEAFKITGARYAVACLGRERLTGGIVCATAGNHGRAVARAAHDLGVKCTVFLPAPPHDVTEIELRTRRARVAAMQADGAQTVDVPGTYENAVARAAAHAKATGATIVSDTSWPGYDEIPRLIMLGYTHLFDEASRQWDRPPDVVLIQGGVGGLVCAAANWFAAHYGAARPFLIACEPDSAACLLESARAGRPVNVMESIPHPEPEPPGTPSPEPRGPSPGSRVATMMAGLRCAEPSPAAWPSIRSGVDAFISIPDTLAVEAMDRLSRAAGGDPCIAAGPSGACGIGALLALVRTPEAAAIRETCGLSRSTRVLAVVTEGP
jgi:diaminopropionate ammonia-lyase